MSSVIHTHPLSYGQSSDLADMLIIELSSNLMQFCELQSGNFNPLYICSFPLDTSLNKSMSDQLLIAINHFKFSKKKYETVLVNEVNSSFTLCPTSFYKSEDTRILLEFNCGNSDNKLVLTDEINPTIKLVYSMDISLKSTLDKLFPQHQLKHSITVLSRLMLNTEELSKINIIVYVRETVIEVIVKQNNQLILANQYTIKITEDVLYYVLFILEQYHLDPTTVLLTLVGNFESNSEIVVSLKKYVKNIYLSMGHKALKWQNLKGMPQHYNYTLLNRLFCE